MKREHYVQQVTPPIDPNILLWLDKTLTDKSSYHRTLTYSGNVVENHEDDHIFLNGGNSKKSQAAYIDIGKLEGLSTNNFSLSFDVKILNSSGYNFSILFSFGGSNNVYGVLGMRLASNVSSGWYASGNRINTQVWSYNTWYHWEFRRLNNKFEILVNNQSAGSSTYGINNNWDNPSWRIGQNHSYASTNNEHMTGYMKNIIVKLI